MLPVDEVRRILRDVADALAYAHERGVVHRDIKPDNILLDAETGRPMVTDFGIARAVSDGDSRLTATGMAIGTPAYMSPEQAAGERVIDGRSDIYALGIVAYQMLAGEPPFSAGSTPAMLVKHISEIPVPVEQRRADVPPDLARAVSLMLQKDPANRFATAGDLVKALDGGAMPVLPSNLVPGLVGLPSAAASAAVATAIGGAPARAAGDFDAAMYVPTADEMRRWNAPQVLAFRKRVWPYLYVNGVIILMSILFRTSFTFVTVIWSIWLAFKYAKLWSDGYDWRDVFQQPRDRTLMEVFDDFMEHVRAIGDSKKRRALLDSRRQRRLARRAGRPGRERRAARAAARRRHARAVGRSVRQHGAAGDRRSRRDRAPHRIDAHGRPRPRARRGAVGDRAPREGAGTGDRTRRAGRADAGRRARRLRGGDRAAGEPGQSVRPPGERGARAPAGLSQAPAPRDRGRRVQARRDRGPARDLRARPAQHEARRAAAARRHADAPTHHHARHERAQPGGQRGQRGGGGRRARPERAFRRPGPRGGREEVSDYLQDRLVAAVGDHYLIEAEIGRGGMAVVFRALDLRLNRHVAIKLLPPDLAFNADVKTRFLREAQMAAQLNHPNIVPIYSVDERDGVVYFVMALVEGETLAQRLHESPRLSFDDVRRVIGDVADALDYAHRKGVVHRDIKPDNIMLDRASGRTMVTDFGIARAAAGDSRLTVTGVAVGTPAYMSPEQALGERDVDGRSDIYSLGVVAYQMLTGVQPFTAANTPAMLVKHVSEAPRPILERRPDTPAPIVHAVEIALAKDPATRWPTGDAFRDAIRAAAVAEAPAAPPRLEQLSATGYVTSPARGGLPGTPGTPGTPGAPLPPLVRLPGFELPSPPIGADRDAWRDWRAELKIRAREFREQRAEWRDRAREERAAWRDERHAHVHVAAASRRDDPTRSIEERVAAFRRRLVGSLSTLLLLFGINMLTSPEFWWWLFFALGIGIGLIRRWGTLWSDGATLKQLFRRGQPGEPAAWGTPAQLAHQPAAPPAPRPLPAPAEPPIAGDAVLAGPHGAAVGRAAGDRIVIREVLAALTPTERQMLPDIAPTVQALVERIGTLATTLHTLDADASGANLGALDQRIADLRREPETAERERRVTLLERQRATVHDLLERRRTLVPRLESACMALQNLKLDLLKLRTAGLDSALGDVTSATQEARTLSRDIGHVLDAAEEVRRL